MEDRPLKRLLQTSEVACCPLFVGNGDDGGPATPLSAFYFNDDEDEEGWPPAKPEPLLPELPWPPFFPDPPKDRKPN